MILKLSLDLPDDGAYIPLARQFGRGLLEYLKVVKEDIGDVETIVTELVANVIRHAQSVDGRFQVLLEYYAERVVIVVVDAGQGFAFRDVPEIGSPRLDMDGGERLGGFGLPLLELMSDLLEFSRTDPHGTTVRAEKRLRYETQEASDDASNMNRTAGGQISVSGG
jgi:anti-sigma regulatory factor (Ser/Thr protein kinase)